MAPAQGWGRLFIGGREGTFWHKAQREWRIIECKEQAVAGVHLKVNFLVQGEARLGA